MMMSTNDSSANNKSDGLQLAIDLARVAHGDKCEDVTIMDLRGVSPVTDFFVICSGTSDRQMRAVADDMIQHAAKSGSRPFGKAGYDGGTWILVDFVNVVAHVFTPEHREFYDLELLWGDVPRIEWSDGGQPLTGTKA